MISKIKNQALKGLSIMLSATTLFTASPIANASNKSINEQTKAQYTKIENDKKEKSKGYSTVKKLVYGGLIVAAGVAGGIGIANVFGKSPETNNTTFTKDETEESTKESVTENTDNHVNSLSPQEIDEKISEQIKIYIDRAPDVFIFDDSMKQMDRRLLLPILTQINYLLDKYEGFTRTLITHKRTNQFKEFRHLRLSCDNNFEHNVLASTSLGMGICFNANCFKKYEDLWNKERISMHRGYSAPCDKTHIILSTATHEFGHLIERLYTVDHPMEKDELIEKIFGNQSKNCLSGYGCESSGEFFAEAFAHLECCKPKNVNKIGRRLENFLVNVANYLPKSKSKFNK